MKYGVVTRVPDPGVKGGTGNLAVGQVYVLTELPGPDNGFMGRVAPAWQALNIPGLVVAIRVAVFTLGEVLVCDDDGRELTGRMRKPDKWDVDVEWYPTVEQASIVAQALER